MLRGTSVQSIVAQRTLAKPPNLVGLERGRLLFEVDLSSHQSRDSDDVEVRCLEAVYRLASAALGHTHLVDEQVGQLLAEKTVEAYAEADCLDRPLTIQQIEDLAVASVGRLLRSNRDLLVFKH